MLSKLDAVNQMLDTIGEDPVSSLSSGLPDAEQAERILDRVKKSVLSKGWQVNTDHDYTMSRNISNMIRVGDTVLRIDTEGKHKHINVAVRKRTQDGLRYLYDLGDQTFVFDKDLNCVVIWNRDWDAITYDLQRYIAALAAVRYQASEMGSVALDKFAHEELLDAWASLQDAEAEAEDSNILRGSPTMRAISQRNNRYPS